MHPIPHGTQSTPAGFTLIELMLYIALTLTILISVVSFFLAGFEAYSRQKIATDVHEETAFVMKTIETYLENATGITSPVPGASDTSLAFTVADEAENPVIISLVDGTLFVSTAGEDPQALHSNRLYVSDAIFENHAFDNDPWSIRMEITGNSTYYISQDSSLYEQRYVTAVTQR